MQNETTFLPYVGISDSAGYHITPISSPSSIIDRKDNIFYVIDHMPGVPDNRIYVNGSIQYFKNTIIDLFNENKIDYTDKKFIFESYLNFDDFKDQSLHTGATLLGVTTHYKIKNPTWDILSNHKVTKKMTFMSNKVRDHRILCSCILANLFDNRDLAYSYVIDKDYPNKIIIDELLLGTNYNFDTSIVLPEKWFTIDPNEEIKHQRHYDFINPLGRNSMFNNLYNKLYKNASISLITEPNFYENGNMLTEKTMMSIYSGHFLIWPGGWKAAETIKKIGIDVFDDIIDHSYQYIEHPGKRVAEAILRNIDLINNVELQNKLRCEHIKRLNNNLTLVRNIDTLLDRIKILNTR